MCAALEGVLKRVFADFDSLQSLERLSGGASQETYRIELLRANEPQVLAMRRASGGVEGEITAAHPGLAVEAQLMQPPPTLACLNREFTMYSNLKMVWVPVLSCSGSKALR
ncbi:MAG: hypothetical protein CM15mP120_03000 [Pseudomonadota bacterium]|nr:MAG: hypothetical protein CM15mP120_03000 [Pseudomonadota bacterium]